MSALDIIVLLLVGWFGVRGFSAGFVVESVSLLTLVVAIIAVKALHPVVADALAGSVGSVGGAAVLAFALIFGLTWFGGKLIAARLGKASKASLLGPFDRLLGLGFGALKAIAIASVAFLGASLVNDTIYGGKSKRPTWMTASQTYPLLNATAGAIVDVVKARQQTGDESSTT